MNKILIVDASDSDIRLMAGLLTRAGYEPICIGSMEAVKREVAKLPPGAVIVTGMIFRDGTAREVIEWMKLKCYKFPVIAIVNNRKDDEAIDIMQDHGAVMIIQRPALDKQLIEAVGKYAKDVRNAIAPGDNLFPRPSKAFERVLSEISEIAPCNSNVLIIGESGMGKEQIAKEIFLQSRLIGTSMNLNVLEAGGAALVGKHNPASGIGKMYGRISSYFEKAKGGTLIIKNIHLLNFDKQSVLLHILTEEHPDVRLICTAEPEILEMVSDKSFRPTLFYNLRQVDISVPSLRETSEDIVPLAEYFLAEWCSDFGKPLKQFDATATKALKLHQWPGNIRELKDVIRLAGHKASGTTISSSTLPISRASPETRDSLLLNDPKLEKRRIIEAMAKTNGNITQAARLLGIGRTTLTYKLKNHGLK